MRPWEETWRVNADQVRAETGRCVLSDESTLADDRQIIAAAPALARALCLAETMVVAVGYDNYGPVCPVCDGLHDDRPFKACHEPGCALDAALTAAGLDAAARKEVRRLSNESS